MHRNKLALFASTALCVTFGFAQTADAASPAIYSWTGFYAGGNLGYSSGKADTTAAVSPYNVPCSSLRGGCTSALGGSNSISLNPNGLIGGGQVGYNWQFAPSWLAGIEADWQWSGQKDSGFGGFTGTNPFVQNGGTCPCPASTQTTDITAITAKLSWFGTVRGRVGLVSNNILLYGTGGLAYGRVSVLGNNTSNATADTFSVTYSTPFSYSNTKTGWTAGGGIEAVIGASNWTWKLEYIHIDLGSIGGGSFGSVPAVTLNTSKFTDEIVRVGLNYRFGAAPLP